MSHDDQPHGALIIYIFLQHDLVIPAQHLDHSRHRSHGKANVWKRVRAVSPDHPTEVLWRELDPPVDGPRDVSEAGPICQIPSSMSWICVRPGPAVPLAGDKIWRTRPAAVGCHDVSQWLLQQHVMAVCKDNEVIGGNAPLADLVLQNLLQHEELQSGGVAVDQDVSRPLAEAHDAEDPAQLGSCFRQDAQAGMWDRIRKGVEVHLAERPSKLEEHREACHEPSPH
mmetsp:Transcript_67486/g.158339  ORF Transcript_67486/g.158339 Transcript_67486/m.158339 type:complete len:226 (+) Transcript_67486:562-1239(+)